MAQLKGASVTWLGHATVLITTPKGTNILIDPFLEQNPKFPQDYKLPEKLDLILATHGHFDHIADVVRLAQKYDAAVIATAELVNYFASKGVTRCEGMNLGGTLRIADVAITQTEAKHTSGIEEEGQRFYGGVPSGFVIAVEDGPVFYHAGDTAVFSDMQLIAKLYGPEFGMLPIGDRYTMGPREAALATHLLGLEAVLPIHYGTWPILTGTTEEFEAHLKGASVRVIQAKPGERIE